jgi:hypothetical protein
MRSERRVGEAFSLPDREVSPRETGYRLPSLFGSVVDSLLLPRLRRMIGAMSEPTEDPSRGDTGLAAEDHAR